MHSEIDIQVLSRANEYIQALPETDRAKVLAHLTFMKENDYTNIVIKKLDGQIRELIVKQHRLVYFKKRGTLYFVSAFKKQSAKTPKNEIEYAKEIYKIL